MYKGWAKGGGQYRISQQNWGVNRKIWERKGENGKKEKKGEKEKKLKNIRVFN
jgi:hypothetical protein